MGKLLDEVLAIHKAKMNHDTSKHDIENNIVSINKNILKRAENSESYLTINFETVNNAIATAHSNTIYHYTVNELSSVKYITKYLSDYYNNEGFGVSVGQFQMYISWDSKLKELNNE